MAQTTLNPSKDVLMLKSAPTVNQNAVDSIQAGEYNAAVDDIRRSLIQFDLSSVPFGSTITVVTLRIHDRGFDYSDNNRIMSFYRCLRVWGETTATWNTYDGSNGWGTVGADNTTSDREATAIGSVSTPNVVVGGDIDITLTVALVQEWLDGVLTNNGMVMRMATELNDLHTYEDRTGADPPRLIITYTPSSGFLALL